MKTEEKEFTSASIFSFSRRCYRSRDGTATTAYRDRDFSRASEK